jgi:hypothetical protein
MRDTERLFEGRRKRQRVQPYFPLDLSISENINGSYSLFLLVLSEQPAFSDVGCTSSMAKILPVLSPGCPTPCLSNTSYALTCCSPLSAN